MGFCPSVDIGTVIFVYAVVEVSVIVMIYAIARVGAVVRVSSIIHVSAAVGTSAAVCAEINIKLVGGCLTCEIGLCVACFIGAVMEEVSLFFYSRLCTGTLRVRQCC